MCGVSGVISKDFIRPDIISGMNKIIRHRGPDDEGFVLFDKENFIVAGGDDTATESWSANLKYCPVENIRSVTGQYQVAFGHRRLSILDLSPAGHQPMCSSDERYWITYNGEIYNFPELRHQLTELGFSFTTHSDTEVILAAYSAWGKDCLNKLNGMWAFAIYDKLEKTLFLSRDRFGIKPLYYWFSPEGNFYFASEIKQFTVLPDWEAKGNKSRILDYLFYSSTDHTDETLFDQVFQIKPGHYAQFKMDNDNYFKDKKVEQVKWNINLAEPFKGSIDEAAVKFADLFEEAVKSHLRADVPVGSALSGGFDSSAVVCSIDKVLNESGLQTLQKTFSSVSTYVKYSEKPWMEAVINHTNVDPYFIYPTAKDAINQIEKITWHMDEPFQSLSPFLSYNIFAKAREEGVIVLLNGQGADEYLSGYGEFDNLLLKKKLFQLKFKSVTDYLRKKRGLSLLNCFKTISFLFLPYQYLQKIGVVNNIKTPLKKLLNNKLSIQNYRHPYLVNNYKRSSLSEISNYQMLNDPLQRYLHWEDRNSMASSTEARVPFLDHKLVEFTRSLPLDYLTNLEQPKLILVRALWNLLPIKIRERKDKMGYISPEELWFKNDFKEEFIDLFDSYSEAAISIIDIPKTRAHLIKIQQGEIPFSYDYWRLIHLCIWLKVFNIKSVA